MNIDKIKIEDRHRNELGDLNDLAASIATDGLLHPIVVTNDMRLIAGQRRLEACRLLGWTDIPIRFAEGVADAASLLRMERDENICRKDMTPSECVALGRALEELERPRAREAQGRRTDLQPSVPANEKFDTREVVAPAVGMSTATYSRAKQLINAAEAGDLVAAEQVIEMDRTGKVTKPYQDWKGYTVKNGPAAPSVNGVGTTRSPALREQRAELIADLAAQGYTSRQMPSKVGVTEETVREIARAFSIEITADRSMVRTRRINSTDVVVNTATALEGLVMGIELIDYAALDLAEVGQWTDSLSDSIKKLAGFNSKIRKAIQ